MYRLLVLVAVLGSALAGGYGKCPKTLGKYPLDEKKLVGDWQMVYSTVAGSSDKQLKCAKFTFEVQDNGHLVTISGIKNDNSTMKGEGFSTPNGYGKEPKDRVSGNSLVVFKKEGADYSPVMMQAIMATDYDSYALIFACGLNFNKEKKTFEPHSKVHLVSRNPAALSQDKIAVLLELVAGIGIDVSTLSRVSDPAACISPSGLLSLPNLPKLV